jgi:hypothetical protein
MIHSLLKWDKKFLDKSSFSVELFQKTNDHDSFSIKVPDSALDSFENYILENSKNLLGKISIIRFQRFEEIRQRFTGVICEINNEKEKGYVNLYIKGLGLVIVLDGREQLKKIPSTIIKFLQKTVRAGVP